MKLVLLAVVIYLAPLMQEPVTLPSPGVVAPVLIHSVDPVMPHKFFGGKVHVVVKCVVDAQGTPTDVHVTTSGGKRYDEAALTAVQQYRFSPATKDGVPVSVSLFVDVTFQYGGR